MASLELAQTFYQNYDSDLFFEKRHILSNVLKRKSFVVKEVDDPLKC